MEQNLEARHALLAENRKSAHHYIASTVRSFHPVGELRIKIVGPGQHCPLKGRKLFKFLAFMRRHCKTRRW